MRFSDVVTASLVAPLVAAHGDGILGAPKVFGLGPNPIAKLTGRNPLVGPAQRRELSHQNSRSVKRQGGVGEHRCGPEHEGAKCDEGYCCSSAGFCGQGKDYCKAPNCLFEYGPGCDANRTPDGESTKEVSRDQLGETVYGGAGVFHCKVPGTIAITYDDGPFIYTDRVLDTFKSYDAKATFFITGNNIGKGAIDDPNTDWPAVIRRMANEGHQVASHTWSHQDLSKISKESREHQIIANEMAIRNIIGKFPTYMRPPYSSCDEDSGCWEDMKNLGYVVSYFNLDTDDYNNVKPEQIQKAKDKFDEAVEPSNADKDMFLAIAHDIHEQTALNLTGYMLDLVQEKGYKAVTMGECLGEPEESWYRSEGGTVSTSSATKTASATSSATGAAASGESESDEQGEGESEESRTQSAPSGAASGAAEGTAAPEASTGGATSGPVAFVQTWWPVAAFALLFV